jgi:Mg2+-importing ATPase
VLDACTHVSYARGDAALDASLRAAIEARAAQEGSEGRRVLALAKREVDVRPAYDHDVERDLAFAGFLVFADPVKPTAAAAVRDLAALGVRVRMLTGDNRDVARHVARAVGLDPQSMLTGAEIARMHDDALARRVDTTALFVEVDPQQKLRVVRALKAAGHAVGYLGDGINDAPSLAVADVGISVHGAVDVARESADVVLLRPDLDVLRRGVEDGRRAFANTLKYVGITTSANFGNMVSMAIATPLLPFLPLVAKQILLNNFLSDIPSVAISTDRVDAERVRRPERWQLAEVRRFMVVFGLVSTLFDLLTFALLIVVFAADERTFRTAWFLVSLATELAVVLVLRTEAPAWRSRPSPALLWTTVVALGVTIAIPYLPGADRVFGFVPIPWPLGAAAAVVVVAYVVATEATKRWFHRTAGSTGPARRRRNRQPR